MVNTETSGEDEIPGVVEIEAVLNGAVPAPKTRTACVRQDPKVECAPPYCPLCVIFTPDTKTVQG